jgi:hypothetical protein
MSRLFVPVVKVPFRPSRPLLSLRNRVSVNPTTKKHDKTLILNCIFPVPRCRLSNSAYGTRHHRHASNMGVATAATAPMKKDSTTSALEIAQTIYVGDPLISVMVEDGSEIYGVIVSSR